MSWFLYSSQRPRRKRISNCKLKYEKARLREGMPSVQVSRETAAKWPSEAPAPPTLPAPARRRAAALPAPPAPSQLGTPSAPLRGSAPHPYNGRGRSQSSLPPSGPICSPLCSRWKRNKGGGGGGGLPKPGSEAAWPLGQPRPVVEALKAMGQEVKQLGKGGREVSRSGRQKKRN